MEVHAPNCYMERDQFFRDIIELKFDKSNIILGGDLNQIENPALDRFPTNNTYNPGWVGLTNIKINLNLTDSLRRKVYNIRNMTRITKISSQLRSATRIDYILVSTHLIEHISLSKSTYINFSDHNQVVAKFGTNPINKPQSTQQWYKIIPLESSSKQITSSI